MKRFATSSADERVLVLATTRGDADLSKRVLKNAGVECESFVNLSDLCATLEEGAGAVLLAEEALARSDIACLVDYIKKQRGWSDLPIILLAQHGADSPFAVGTMDLLSNVTVLEQPVRITTLISAIRTSLKARRRQYQFRDQVEAQALLAAIIESSEDAIVSKTLDGTIISWNKGAERIFGYTSDEAIDKPITLIIPPERLDEEKTIIQKLVRGERIEHFETVRLAKSGRRIDISLTISPVRDNTGQIIAASKVARDITDRKRAQRALRESEQRFRFLAETIPSIIWTAGPDGTINYANRRWLEFCGSTPEQTPVTWPQLTIHPDDYEHCMSRWHEALSTGSNYEVEVRYRRYDGVYRWFMSRAVPLRDSIGQIISWFGVTIDIHDQKEMQEHLRDVDRRKDEFLATLAHELRNPLAPIRNSVQLLLMTDAEPAAREQAAKIIERQVSHLVRLVDDLLEVSRITRGKIELRKESVDLAEVVNTAVETSRPLIDAANHTLEVQLPTEPLLAEIDAVRISQVIANLLNNAAKYTEPGGRIFLTVRAEDGDLIISVRDNGVGIPADMLGRVFEMFAQGDRSLSRSQGGLGIGLTLSQRLIHLHGGTIEALSEGPGLGSEFIVRLPRLMRVINGESDIAALPANGKSGSELRILVVDDNIDSAESLGLWLRLMGHNVRMVNEGLAAVEAAREYHPDVVVLDIGLPDVDGCQVAQWLRQDPEMKGVLLIALTGYGRDEDRQRCYDAGFDEHLIKPVEPSLLEGLLSSR
jgi:PAS domain S-box-containing protein